MTMQTTLRPGLLVALKTSVSGNVRYQKKILKEGQIDELGAHTAVWETEREIKDFKEQELATKVRSQARGFIAAVCSFTSFGYLCPEADKDTLDAAVAKARTVADDFNRTAKYTRVYVNVISGRIAPDDVEAVKAINGEVRELLAEMEAGIKKLDVKAIRDAAVRARQIGQMLSPDAQARITIAIEAARATATKIKAAGDQAAAEIDAATIRKLTEARTAFLDLDDASEFVAPTTAGRAVDFTPPSDGGVRTAPSGDAPQLDLI